VARTDIAVADRLILAADLPSTDDVRRLADDLGDAVTFYKLGLALLMRPGYWELVDWLVARNKKVFADIKVWDVPETVRNTVRQLRDTGVTFATIHGQDDVMRAAAEEKGAVKILAVTVLTSWDKRDFVDMGVPEEHVDVERMALSRARRALELGLDGVIASALDAPALRREFADRLLVVSPGIRAQQVDDQKRIVDVEEAFRRGADYIVVGRPIYRAADRRAAAEDMLRRIREVSPRGPGMAG
jgi:orotidine-5'-phosphate decarboxylase